MQWWEVNQLPPADGILPPSPGIDLVTVSAETVPGLLGSIAVAGLIGLYVGVVLSVGRFLRLWVSSLIHRIYLDDMPNADELLKLCEDIFIAR